MLQESFGKAALLPPQSKNRARRCVFKPTIDHPPGATFLDRRSQGVVEPFLTLQAIGRNGARDPFDYVVVVTVRAEKYEGDIYTAIRNEYPALAPIRLRTEAETRVQIA